MEKIQLTYEYNGKIKTFSCNGWAIYETWMPNQIKPIKLTIEKNGQITEYLTFNVRNREKFGINFKSYYPEYS